MRILFGILALFAGSLWAAVAGAEDFPAGADGGPILRLDAGGHQGDITGLSFTPDGRFIVSVGEDKTVRIWDWRRGKTARIIRGESGPGNGGKIHAMALSPDGGILAIGGHIGPANDGSACCGDIRLYDFKSGELAGLLKGHTDIVLGLTFSNDGKKLISSSRDTTAIIWDVKERTALHRLEGHRDQTYATGFSPDGSLALTGSLDKVLRIWDAASGNLLKEATGHGEGIYTLAVSSTTGVIATGDEGGELRLWDGKTGELQRVLAKGGGEIGSLRFSPDGGSLLSTCSYNACSSHLQRIYDAASGKELIAYAKHDQAVIATGFSPDGSLVATGGGNDKEIHVWDSKTGETKAVLKGTGQAIWAVGFSADGRSIAWGNTAAVSTASVNDLGPVEFTLRLPSVGKALSEPTPASSAEDWIRARASFGDLVLQHRKGGSYGFDAFLDLLKDGKPTGVSVERTARNGLQHRSYGFSPDGKTIVSGGNAGYVVAYGLDGKTLGQFEGHTSEVWALAASPDGRYLLSGSADQTVRLWNLQTRELLVTIFRGTDGEWAMWTPQGYYTGSPGADKIVGWQINRGPDKSADFFTAEQLRKHLNRPDIVAKAIQLASAIEAVRTSYGTEFKLSDLLERPAPHLRIVSPTPDSTVKSSSADVRIALDATPDPVTRIRIQVNGRQLNDFLPESSPKFEAGEYSFKVPLVKGKNSIVATAFNEIGWSKVEDGVLTLVNESSGELDRRGTLYILAIGVTKYAGIANLCDPNCDLEFTGSDAIAFANSVEKQLGSLHSRVVRRVLVNGGKAEDEPTAINIVDALGVLSRTRENDTVAVFLAGHGMNDGPNYRFIPTDATLIEGEVRRSSIVPWYAIEEAIDGAKGRRLLFIDTCHSAGAYNERLGNTAYYANILAYSAARWDQVAWESPSFGHGFFTQAIVEGLEGAADVKKDGEVDTLKLKAYLQSRVRELAKTIGHEQDPQFFKGRDAEVYTLAVVH